MRIGYRIRSEDEVGYCGLTLAQISLWRNGRHSLDDVKRLAQRCRTEGIRYVIHPINFFISETRPEARGENLKVILEIDGRSGLSQSIRLLQGLIVNR